MKQISFAFVALLPGLAAGQDIITTTSGENIKARISEVTDTHLKYTRFESPSGPTYTKSLSGIFKVIYENGAEELFSKNNVQLTEEFLKISKESPEKLLEKGNSVYVEIPNESSRAGEKYFVNDLKDWGYWTVVEDINSAHFIIEFNIEKKPMLDKKSWVVFKTREGTEFKKSKQYRATTNAFSGYNAFKEAAQRLIKKYFVTFDFLK